MINYENTIQEINNTALSFVSCLNEKIKKESSDSHGDAFQEIIEGIKTLNHIASILTKLHMLENDKDNSGINVQNYYNSYDV